VARVDGHRKPRLGLYDDGKAEGHAVINDVDHPRKRTGRRYMARIFITGSADGLGRAAAELLIERGHGVVLHARNEQRAAEARATVPRAEALVTGDLSSVAQTRRVAEQVNALGAFDAVIDKEPSVTNTRR